MLYTAEQLYDAALTRAVELKRQLKSVVETYHKDMGHTGDWTRCPLRPCQLTQQIVDEALFPSPVEDDEPSRSSDPSSGE